MPTTTRRLTGLQRDVLSLYRACLRQVRLKPVVRVCIQFRARWPATADGVWSLQLDGAGGLMIIELGNEGKFQTIRKVNSLLLAWSRSH